MHDGVDPADELVHADDLLQVLLCELQHLQDVQTKEIIPAVVIQVSSVKCDNGICFVKLLPASVIRTQDQNLTN